MISMICQKSNSGIISSDNKDLFNLAILNDQIQINQPAIINTNDDNNTIVNSSSNNPSDWQVKSSRKNTEYSSFVNLDSNFLKKFPTLTKIEKKDITYYNENGSVNRNFFKSEGSSGLRVSRSISPNNTNTNNNNNNNPKSATTKTVDFDSIYQKQNTGQSFNTFSYGQAASNDYYNQNPLRKLNSKNLKSMQNWINQKINEDPSNLEYYHKLNEVIAREKELTEEIRRDIEISDIRQLRKKELIYKNWHLNVYEPIQKEIFKNMNGPNANYARTTRNLRYLEYLHQVNKRGGVFQDDYQPEEYDPINVVPLDATLPNQLKDPTTIPQRKNFKEEKTIYKCITGKKFGVIQTERTKLPIILNDNETRGDLDWNRWLLNEYNTIESSARKKS